MISIKNLGLELAQREIFSNLNITVRRGEKLGITGGEGAGKSSLLDILAGRLMQTAGEVTINGECLTVTGNISADFSELRMAEMSALEKLKRTLRHLNDSEIVLLLDEPTKNLDAEGIEWLINFLLERPNLTAVIVSNDRYFINRTCPEIIRLGNIQVPEINLDCAPLPENTAVLTVKSLAKTRAGETLFQHIGFTIRQGQKVALVGKNNLGRSKLLKTLYTAWQSPVTNGGAEGKINFDESVKVAYMPRVYSSATAKIELEKIQNTGANCLLLDAPTACLDLPAIEEFERALINFKGTIIFSEEDRAFLENVANRIIDVAPSGTIDRISSYEEFLANETVKQQIKEKYSF
jgi:ATPase subunit of ABC transporter with duplicated ATPase domains